MVTGSRSSSSGSTGTCRWRLTDRADVERILHLVEHLATTEGDDTLQPCLDAHPGLAGHWGALLTEPADGLDAWSLLHLEELADLERDAAEAVHGDRLVHMDLRSDNILFATRGEQHDVAVDWPGASLGAPWVDLVGAAPGARARRRSATRGGVRSTSARPGSGSGSGDDLRGGDGRVLHAHGADAAATGVADRSRFPGRAGCDRPPLVGRALRLGAGHDLISQKFLRPERSRSSTV